MVLSRHSDADRADACWRSASERATLSGEGREASMVGERGTGGRREGELGERGREACARVQGEERSDMGRAAADIRKGARGTVSTRGGEGKGMAAEGLKGGASNAKARARARLLAHTRAGLGGGRRAAARRPPAFASEALTRLAAPPSDARLPPTPTLPPNTHSAAQVVPQAPSLPGQQRTPPRPPPQVISPSGSVTTLPPSPKKHHVGPAPYPLRDEQSPRPHGLRLVLDGGLSHEGLDRFSDARPSKGRHGHHRARDSL